MVEVEAPLTFVDRTTYDKNLDNYLFVSYSHKDSKKVFKILHLLYEKYINYWYDIELSTGKRWDETVKHILLDSHCKGCLCFVSKAYLKSDACFKEYEFIKGLIPKGFVFFPIHIEDEGIEELFKTTPKSELKIQDFEEENSLLRNEILFRAADDLELLIRDIKKTTKGIVHDKESIIEFFLENKLVIRQNRNFLLTLGMFPQNDAISINRKATGKIIIDEWDEKYFGSPIDGLFYPFQEIEWRIIDANDAVITLISNHCLFPCRGNKDSIQKRIQEIKAYCFDQEIQEQLDLSLVDISYKKYLCEENDFKPTSFLLNNYPSTKDIYWYTENQMIKLMGKKMFQEIENFRSKENQLAGILLILKINTNYFKKRGMKNGSK